MTETSQDHVRWNRLPTSKPTYWVLQDVVLIHPNIFLKSSCPFPLSVSVALTVLVLVVVPVDAAASFLAAPKPARGLERADLGTNMPPVPIGGATGRDDVLFSSGSPDISKGTPLN